MIQKRGENENGSNKKPTVPGRRDEKGGRGEGRSCQTLSNAAFRQPSA